MENINALILDDEEYSRSSLYFLLQSNCPKVTIVNISSSVKEATAFILENEVNLVFLDIAMPRENGFVLIPLLQEKKIMVVFTTAFDKYALKAIKASAVDYLLKPLDIIELVAAVDKATFIHELKSYKYQYQDYSKTLSALSENINNLDQRITKLTIASSTGFRIISLADIIYLEADSNYSILHMNSGEKIVATKPLKDYETLLNDNNFIRIHKSHIINILHLHEYNNTNGTMVKLANGVVINVSRRRMPDFLERIKKSII